MAKSPIITPPSSRSVIQNSTIIRPKTNAFAPTSECVCVCLSRVFESEREFSVSQPNFPAKFILFFFHHIHSVLSLCVVCATQLFLCITGLEYIRDSIQVLTEPVVNHSHGLCQALCIPRVITCTLAI